MKLEKALEELKNDLNNKMNERIAVEKFISSLNIEGLFYGGRGSLTPNTFKIKVCIINGRNTNIVLFYIRATFENKEKRTIKSLWTESLNYHFSTYEELVELVKRVKMQYINKYEKDAEKFLALAKELNISNEVAIQLGEAFYHLNPNSKDIILKKEDSYKTIYGKDL